MMTNLALIKLNIQPEDKWPAYSLFAVPGFNLKLIGDMNPKKTTNERFLKTKGIEYLHVDKQKLLPGFVNRFFFRPPLSVTSFVKLRGLADYLGGVDVVILPEVYSFVSNCCVDIAKKHEMKVLIDCWETISTLPIFYFPPYSRNIKKVKRHADLFLVHTLQSASCLKRLGVCKEKIKLVYPGIDIEFFKPPEKDFDNAFRILFVGRYDEEKGLSILLDVFLRLYREYSHMELWIRASGRGIIAEKAKMLSNKLPINFIEFTPLEQLPSIYQHCDVLCLPSFDRKKSGIKVWEEQFGFVLLEAMACGLPIVSTYCGAIPEVIGYDNIIVPQKSSQHLFLALKQLLLNEDLTKSIGQSNREKVEKKYNLNKQREKLRNILLNEM